TCDAKRRDRSTCDSDSTLIAKCVACTKAPTLVLARRSDHSTSGGSSDSALKELAVSPTGAPPPSVQLTMVTPVVKRPSAARSACGESSPLPLTGAPSGCARSLREGPHATWGGPASRSSPLDHAEARRDAGVEHAQLFLRHDVEQPLRLGVVDDEFHFDGERARQ